MERKDLIAGILQAEGYLVSETGRILRIQSSEDNDQRSDMIPLEIRPEDVGRLAFVRGYLSENVFYGAKLLRSFQKSQEA